MSVKENEGDIEEIDDIFDDDESPKKPSDTSYTPSTINSNATTTTFHANVDGVARPLLQSQIPNLLLRNRQQDQA